MPALNERFERSALFDIVETTVPPIAKLFVVIAAAYLPIAKVEVVDVPPQTYNLNVIVFAATFCNAEIPDKLICDWETPSTVLVKLTSVPISVNVLPSVLYVQIYALGAVAPDLLRVASKEDNDTLKFALGLSEKA